MATEQAATIRQSELRMRILSAVVLAAVALAAELVGGLAFAALVTIMAAIAFWEWTAMTGASEPLPLRALVLACLAAGLMALSFDMTDIAVGLLALPAFLALAAGFLFGTARWLGYGLAYVALPCAALIVLRQAEPHGWAAVLFILLVVWATDIAAYFGGRSFGGPKLWARVSPKKTWSGAVSGLAAGVVAGGLLVWLADAGKISAGLLLAAPLSIAAQGGDLMESAVKRHFDVKDSGKIIPGHGGVLDRVDGLFAAAALAWLIAGIGIGGDILALPREIVTARAP